MMADGFDPMSSDLAPGETYEQHFEDGEEMYMSENSIRFPVALEKALDLKSERIKERVAGEPIIGKILIHFLDY